MAEQKAEPKAVFCTNIELPAGVHVFETDDTATKAPDADPIKRVIYMDDRVVPGSFYVEAVWVVGSIPRSHPEHTHDHDEIVGFVGSNMDDPADLGAEIDFRRRWREDDHYQNLLYPRACRGQTWGALFQKNRQTRISDRHVEAEYLFQCSSHIGIKKLRAHG